MENLQAFKKKVTKILEKTEFKERHLEVAQEIKGDDSFIFSIRIAKEDEVYLTELSVNESSEKRCLLRLEFELKMRETA